MNHLQSCFVRNSDVSWKTLEDKCILLHLSSGYYYTLNEVGRFLWESLDGKKKLEEIYKEIINHYSVDTETAKNDILKIIQNLTKEGLVEEYETLKKSS